MSLWGFGENNNNYRQNLPYLNFQPRIFNLINTRVYHITKLVFQRNTMYTNYEYLYFALD